MQTVNIHHAKTHFSRLVDAAAKGEEIVIARAGLPVARLVPLEPAAPKTRTLGCLAHLGDVPDDFDAPLPPEVLALFHGD